MATEYSEYKGNCVVCQKRVSKSAPLMTTELPGHPWMHLSADLFRCLGRWYFVVQDYYFSFLEILNVVRLITQSIVARLKNRFAKLGSPLSVRSGGGTQFKSASFYSFAKEIWN